MTKWTEQPLRQQGAPWPGLNTRGGRLDDGSGQLEDGSVNCMINEADILSKRKGLIRGLDEWFGAVVCGLFKYTDACGIERILVADETGISIRQPFEIPEFSSSDAYPVDSFAGDGVPSSTNWRNRDRYQRVAGELQMVAGAAAMSAGEIPSSFFMRWFKEAATFSYRVRAQYNFDDDAPNEQRVGVVIRGNEDLSTGALLQAEIEFIAGSTYQVKLYYRTAAGAYTQLLERGLTGNSDGFLELRYSRDEATQQFVPRIIVTPTAGSIVDASAETLKQLQDTDLGLVSAIGIAHKGSSVPATQIQSVEGSPL